MKIVIIGSGGVAESFYKALLDVCVSPLAIVSPSKGNAESIIMRYGQSSTLVFHNLQDIPKDADLYLFCIPDKEIEKCAKRMPETQGVWMHTSACVSLKVLENYHKESAVFYPLCTFSRGRNVDLSKVPILYEAEDEVSLKRVLDFLCLLKMKGKYVSIDQRRKIHLAAVFACNFVNYQWSIAESILEEENLDKSLLYPLIEETLDKMKFCGAKVSQTGPAYRGDKETQEEHLSLLKDNEERFVLYEMLTHCIENMK